MTTITECATTLHMITATHTNTLLLPQLQQQKQDLELHLFLGKLSMQGLSDYAIVDNANENDARARLVRSEILESAKRSLLRSKGFVWMATSAAGAYFMSHAGQYLELIVLGRWWSDINEEEWPE
eukprot:gene59437-79311_t